MFLLPRSGARRAGVQSPPPGPTMAARAIASTTISFGLVSLPVKLYSTGEPGARVSFNLVHAECGTRLKQHYTCPQCDVTVGRDEMVKGYEFSKGQYVLFGEDELK